MSLSRAKRQTWLDPRQSFLRWPLLAAGGVLPPCLGKAFGAGVVQNLFDTVLGETTQGRWRVGLTAKSDQTLLVENVRALDSGAERVKRFSGRVFSGLGALRLFGSASKGIVPVNGFNEEVKHGAVGGVACWFRRGLRM